ncbi:MAG TPA: tRNA uridine-5-carboxymethylaminomethyl(34) synthesis GTPase MnmE [Candidatus Binatia bacterium]|nr:tRNA uridine-5-carboxymethylaminomethyl(34) synthesis GTPase MnmE [Candidatus Binatia bacterium]
MYKEDTIAAIATPPGEGGVGIVRVSGPDAERIAAALFVRADGKNGGLKSHMLHYGTIRDPKSDKVFDQVLLTIMHKPHSYTGEDVVEVHCHGGVFLVQRILGLVLSQGARHAEPGEFTKRAFLNGRLDLAQAEAVLDLIAARTEKGVDLALSQIKGELSNGVGDLREELLDILAQVEAAIDFPEEEIELLERPALIAKVDALRTKINAITDTYEWGRLFREGAKVCICGRPNVGKSSLFNSLLGAERVIVTPIPGTTRDVIEESINLGGLPVALWDTAGIRGTTDQVEQIGVNLSREHLEKSDAAIVVLDGSAPLTDEDKVFLSSTKRKKGLIAINKIDLEQSVDLDELRHIVREKKLVTVSATHGYGIQELKRLLRELILPMDTEPPIVLTNLRHKGALLCGEQALADAGLALHEMQPTELIAVALQQARESLEEVIGAVYNEDILELIFSKFCIGK